MEHLIEFKDVYKIYQMGDESVHALDGMATNSPRSTVRLTPSTPWTG